MARDDDRRFHDGSGTGIRTPINGFKARCPAVGRYPNDQYLYPDISRFLTFLYTQDNAPYKNTQHAAR